MLMLGVLALGTDAAAHHAEQMSKEEASTMRPNNRLAFSRSIGVNEPHLPLRDHWHSSQQAKERPHDVAGALLSDEECGLINQWLHQLQHCSGKRIYPAVIAILAILD